MANWIALSRQRHLLAGWQAPANYNFAKNDHLVPVLAEEVPKLLASKVLAFTRQSADQFIFVTLMSLKPEENWFVNPHGKWVAGYSPSLYRSYPFRLLSINPSNTEMKGLCVDTDSGLWFDEIGVEHFPVFTEEGELSQKLSEMLTFLKKCEDNRLLTQHWVDQLDEAGVIVPWNIQWQPDPEGSVQGVKGLYRIDEGKLKALSGDQLKGLTESGALSLAYGQLYSMHHLSLLKALYQAWQRTKGSAPVEATSTDEPDLDELFGGDDDVLKF